MRRMSQAPIIAPASRGKFPGEVPPRRRPLSTLEIWTRRAGIALGCVSVIGALGFWSWHSGWLGRSFESLGDIVLSATADWGLKLDEIEIKGRSQSARADVLAAIGASRGDPILGLDLVEMRDHLEALPWIVSAELERRYPNRLLVSLTEAEPLALWQRNQQLYLVSRNGEVIETADLKRYAKLLIIVGEEAPQNASALFEMLAHEPALAKRVTAAVFVGKRRWNLRFDNSIDVKLPEEHPESAWARFAELQRSQGVLEKDVTVIDLRLPDQIVLRQAHPKLMQDEDGKVMVKPEDKET